MPNEKTEELDLSSLPDEEEAVSEEAFKPAPAKKPEPKKAEAAKEGRPHSDEAASIAKQTKAAGEFIESFAERAKESAIAKVGEASKHLNEAIKKLDPKPIDRDVQKDVSDKILSKSFSKTAEIPEGKLTDEDLKDDGEPEAKPAKATEAKKKTGKSHDKIRMLVTSDVEFVSKDALKKAFAGAVGIKNGWYSAIVNGVPTVIDGTDNACIKAISAKIKAILPKGSKAKDADLYPCAYELLKTLGFGIVELGASVKKAPKAKAAPKKKPAERYTVVDKDVIGTVIYDSLNDLRKAYRLRGDGPFNVTINGGAAVISKAAKAVDGSGSAASLTKELDSLLKIAEDVCKPKTSNAWAALTGKRADGKVADLLALIYKAAGIRLVSL